ncbi:MAG: deoxyribose-phosphate aldolase [Phascolarctobacterium sp.]|uniref:deoxyribose-phosphate aldolase n=1 Tax=Phascolarctobacterium sp. TaxID=2049039 RepID=UPI0025D9BC2F|nr:deoxyribose-phosphate aldolase [Phascolarctobacterium sp.]MCC8157701.1 deoxyribose-phosphate aldolase [Phascolarctobacterium sp.]
MTIAQHLEHTLLKPEATVEDIMLLCRQAKEQALLGVCVNPCYVALARHLLSGTDVKVVTVVGFPLGATFSEVKALEAKMAVEAHADEIDMVMNIAAFKTGDYAAVVSDIRSVVEAAKPFPVKVIIEACLLTDAEKRTACRLVAEGGATFVKTSTGFNQGGATVGDVELLAAEAKKYGLKVKAAGGIRDAATAQAMLDAGAERIGTSAGHKIAAGEA